MCVCVYTMTYLTAWNMDNFKCVYHVSCSHTLYHHHMFHCMVLLHSVAKNLMIYGVCFGLGLGLEYFISQTL